MSSPHEHEHDHGHDHDDHGLVARLRALFVPHSHDAAVAVDAALESSARGIRALQISLVGLGITAVVQAVVVVASGSVALLGDTLHNVADALTALPLWLAFTLGRRAPTRRFTYGYGRAEDLAGVAIVLTIAGSSAFAAYEAAHRLLHPSGVRHLLAVGVAGVVGFAGNELVARYRIRVGRDIGSAALVADGLHARTDGLTSLAVLAGAIGVGLGHPVADPLAGLFITVALLLVLRRAGRDVYHRLMDAVDPALVDAIDTALRLVPGVVDIGDTRLRWIGHNLRAEATVVVADDLSVVAAHRIADEAEHRLLHDVPRLAAALIHADPAGADHHDHTSHHR